MDFGPLLRERRLAAGKTLGQVADFLGVSIPYVSDVERGNRAPLTAERIKNLADYLRIDPHPLLIAASQARGAYELPAGQSAKHEEVGASLMRGWTDLLPEDLDEIQSVIRKRRGSA